ncbi:3D-(3,5/4)-trihydroxycyclohexane-1,2-dione acylhydrolase (decyclizing), partial [Rhizobium leguminosarum]
ESLFDEKVWPARRPQPDADKLANAIALIKASQTPAIVAGGGVLYSQATKAPTTLAEAHSPPVAVSPAGKSAINETHPLSLDPV